MFLWIFSLFLALPILTVCQPVPPSTELRGLWIATVNNMDYPSAPGLDPTVQRQEMLTYLDIASDLNLNMIMFHVRPAGDAFYDSPIEPWSVYLTGTQGLPPNPLYDPLEFFVTEAHARNIQVHAWVNPYRANLSPNWDGLDPKHVAMRYPQYAYPYGTYLWMDPASDEVLDNFINVLVDLLTRYDIDGIHYDDYFYPYPEAYPFPDDATYEEYVTSGGNMTLGDWRRDNINRMVERVYTTVKSLPNPKAVSIAPYGSYRPGHPEGMPPPVTGFDPYEELYADSKLWLQQGWVDHFIPLLYANISHPEQSYSLKLNWWLEQNTANRFITAGLAAYKTDPLNGDWSITEIGDEIWLSRDQANRDRGSMGNVLFSGVTFLNNLKGLNEYLKSQVYTNNATVPGIL